ncbi:hypothetical protein [Thermus sp.]|uniref:hypothetical protein n=1 Tax=Thermus sp. TaxID=275 RepID=UPI00321F7BCC
MSKVKGWLVDGSPSTHALVANITPNRNTASLGEIVGIWGYYYPAWTPRVGPWTVIMLKLKMLWVDTIPGPGWVPLSKPPFWQAFPAPTQPGRSVFEFFYATYEKERWRMRGFGLYNAPLLHPDALACLFQAIRGELRREPDQCGEGVDLCDCDCDCK